MIDKNIIELFGIKMHAWTMDETVQVIRERLVDGVFTQHVCVSAGKLVAMQDNAVLTESVRSCDIVNIDGAGLTAFARLLGYQLPDRVAGIDLFESLLVMAEQLHYAVFFLGAEDPVVEKMVRCVRKDYPQLEIVGYHHGYFWDNEEALVVQEISASGTVLLFVGMPSPKKENFIAQWSDQLGVKFVMGVGGSFDVLAGKVKRAPKWVQDFSLEWMFRIIQEPRRLWKRYLVNNSKFIYMVIKAYFNQDYRKYGSIILDSEKKHSTNNVIEMFGLMFNACSLSQAVELVINAGIDRKKGLVVTPNVDHLMKLEKDALMREIFHTAMFRFADGMPLVWFSKLFMKSPLPERVTGADLLPAVASQAAKKGVKLFLLGGEPGVASLAAEKLTQNNPGLDIAGIYCPPFGFEYDADESLRIVDMINASGADILFIGVGAPKQEKWAYRHFDQLQVGPMLGVGAAFDFAAGTIRRCPRWIQSIGAEWLYRLLSEPGRLWRRYLVEDIQFLALAIREWQKIRRQKRNG